MEVEKIRATDRTGEDGEMETIKEKSGGRGREGDLVHSFGLDVKCYLCSVMVMAQIFSWKTNYCTASEAWEESFQFTVLYVKINYHSEKVPFIYLF